MTEIVTKVHILYPGMSNAEIKEQTGRGYKMPQPLGCHEPLYQIMLHCWNNEPERRPTFEHLQHTLEDYFVSTEPIFCELNQTDPLHNCKDTLNRFDISSSQDNT